MGDGEGHGSNPASSRIAQLGRSVEAAVRVRVPELGHKGSGLLLFVKRDSTAAPVIPEQHAACKG